MALVLIRDASCLLVLLLCALEVPLLLVGEVFDDEEEECKAREGKVGETERFSSREAREENEVVGRRRHEQKQQRLNEADKGNVEQEEEEAVVNMRLHDLPAVVLRTDLIPSLAPVVERQSDLSGVKSQRQIQSPRFNVLTPQSKVMRAMVSKL